MWMRRTSVSAVQQPRMREEGGGAHGVRPVWRGRNKTSSVLVWCCFPSNRSCFHVSIQTFNFLVSLNDAFFWFRAGLSVYWWNQTGHTSCYCLCIYPEMEINFTILNLFMTISFSRESWQYCFTITFNWRVTIFFRSNWNKPCDQFIKVIVIINNDSNNNGLIMRQKPAFCAFPPSPYLHPYYRCSPPT